MYIFGLQLERYKKLNKIISTFCHLGQKCLKYNNVIENSIQYLFQLEQFVIVSFAFECYINVNMS